jgi:hypothetical protein
MCYVLLLGRILYVTRHSMSIRSKYTHKQTPSEIKRLFERILLTLHSGVEPDSYSFSTTYCLTTNLSLPWTRSAVAKMPDLKFKESFVF